MKDATMPALPILPGRLLIVDDEPGLRTILEEVLRNTVSQVETASDGKDALQKIRAGSVDVVISDINMPVMDGIELLANVRDLQIECPFIFLTGYGDKEKAVEALRLGATDFLDKPFDPDEIIAVVRKAMELALAMKEAETEVESMYAQGSIPADRRIKLRKMRRAVMMMRRTANIYSKKS